MSFLSMMFLGGAAAVAVPLIFHLIRRTPKGKQEFSTLMFLSPSPPRMTKRSRLDNWLLLLLRGLVIVLLAMAFSRPFFRAYAESSEDRITGRRIALLVDRSASMQREAVWQKAVQTVKERVNSSEAGDQLSLYVFDETVQKVFESDSEKALPRKEQNRLILDEMKLVKPTWKSTDIGQAVVTVADSLVVEEEKRDRKTDLQIVLISDLQDGADLNALQEYDWPKQVKLDVVPCDADSRGNATLELIANENAVENAKETKVRVRNSTLSQKESFTVSWAGTTGEERSSTEFYVPPGESRALPVPRPSNAGAFEKVTLIGDESRFDNTFFVPGHIKPACPVYFVGKDQSDDPDGLLFYLQQWAVASTSRFDVKLKSISTEARMPIIDQPSLMILSGTQSEETIKSINSAVRVGNLTALIVLRDETVSPETAEWLSIDVNESSSTADYELLRDIQFEHLLFEPFRESPYNDFTSVRFWRHRHVILKDAENDKLNVLAKFQDGSPALWEVSIGNGRLYVMSSGWNPDDSYFGRSTKFVPFLSQLAEISLGPQLTSDQFMVGESIPIPADLVNSRLTMSRPDGSTETLSDGSATYENTDQPGIYTLNHATNSFRFAVNLKPEESRIDPITIDRFEQFGVQVGRHSTQEEKQEAASQMRDRELEQTQKVWKWLVVFILCILGIETLLAARQSATVKVAAEPGGTN